MNKKILSILLAASLTVSSAAITVAARTEDAARSFTPDVVYNFGGTDADGAITVPADTEYTASRGYGFFGLSNGHKVDSRVDGWTMTQGYDLVLENGGEGTGVSDTWVATTVRDEKGTAYCSPIRFAMASPTNSYYKIRVNLRRADASKEARVNLFTEKRHQRLLDEPIPADGLVYEGTVHVHNNWGKNSGEYVDNMLNIAAEGENVAISSIEVKKLDTAKTLWILGDSTVCEQTAGIPYFPLNHCQGVGSAVIKYLGEDWSLVNEAESGLAASSARNHFANFSNHIQPGDIVWFEFGHNDDKSNTDPAVNGYLSYLETYYKTVSEKGAYFVAVAPITRCTTGQFADGKWSPSLMQYGAAAKEFAEARIAEGKTDITYIELTQPTADFLTDVYSEMSANGIDYGAGSASFYYLPGEYTHPNDYGADNFAYLFMEEAAKKAAKADAYVINSDKDTEAARFDAEYDENGALVNVEMTTVALAEGTNYLAPKAGAKTYVWDSADGMKPYTFGEASVSDKVQANICKMLVENRRDTTGVRVSKEIYSAGKVTNKFYPPALAEVVKYQYPIILDEITFDENGAPATVSGSWVNSDLTCTYAYVRAEIYNADGTLKGSVMTTDFFDHSGDDAQILTFDVSDVTFNAQAGDTFRAYAVEYVDGEGGGLTDTLVSTTLTEDSIIDIKDTLIEEKFEDYAITGTIIGANGWKLQGAGTFLPGEDADVSYGIFKHTDATKTAYVYRNFSAVTSGQLMVKYDLRYNSGKMQLHLTDGTKDANNWSIQRVTPLEVYLSGSEVKVALEGKEVCSIDSGVWTTIKLVVDFDYGKYYLTVAGNTYTADIPGMNTTGVPSPDKLACVAYIANRFVADYDIANLTVASLNTAELPDYTVELKSSDNNMGSVVGSGSYKMNTTVNLKAVPASGHVFTNWTAADGSIYSEDSEISFRLRENLSLTANFAVQRGLDSVVDYSITADKIGLKAEEGRTIQLGISNPVDKDGNLTSDVENSDAVWSCDADGITVDENGLVTVADYTLPKNSTGSVNVTATLNGITKKYEITTYSYAYYELAEEGKTNYDGAFRVISGRTAMIFNTGKSSTLYTLSDTIALDKPTTIRLSQAASGSNTAVQKRYYEFLNSSGTVILDMYYVWGGLFVGGSEIPGVLGMNSWSDITIEIDPETSTATVSAAGDTKTVACNCSDIAAIRFRMADNTGDDRYLGVSSLIIEQ